MSVRRPARHFRDIGLAYDQLMGDDSAAGEAHPQRDDLDAATRTAAPREPGERAASSCHVVHEQHVGEMHLSRDGLERLQEEGGFFWIDVHKPTPQDLELLREVFKFHPLAIEDSEHFGQRAKIDDYDEFAFIVVYGAVPDEDRLVEVHCFYSEHYLITLHHDTTRRRPSASCVAATSCASSRSTSPRCCFTRSSRRSSTASSPSSPTSTTASTSSRTAPSSRPATHSCRRSLR